MPENNAEEVPPDTSSEQLATFANGLPRMICTATEAEVGATIWSVQMLFTSRFLRRDGKQVMLDEVGVVLPLAAAKALHVQLGKILDATEETAGKISLPEPWLSSDKTPKRHSAPPSK